MTKTVTISKVRYVGKWVEFWFDEGHFNDPILPYHASAKNGYLDNAIDSAGIYDDIMSTGLVGYKMVWEFKSPNWEIVSIIPKYPYTKYENTPNWKVLKEAIRVLSRNNDLKITSEEKYVICYLCKALENNN